MKIRLLAREFAAGRRAVRSAFLFCALGSPSMAQIGSGWTEYFPEKSIQRWGQNRVVPGNTEYSNVDGVETFAIHGNDERCEARIQDNYTSGTTQFQGEFFMVNHDGTSSGEDVSIAQVWLSMIVSLSAVNGGSLYQHSPAFATGVMGKWVRLNIYHSADANRGEVWVDGRRMWSGATKDSDPFYHKYGVYNEARNNPEIMWRGVRFWRNGTTVGAIPILRPLRPIRSHAVLAIFDLGGRRITAAGDPLRADLAAGAYFPLEIPGAR
jgi:hypothetical protein